MKQVYAPGCALMIYKPELAKKVLEFLNEDLSVITKYLKGLEKQILKKICV